MIRPHRFDRPGPMQRRVLRVLWGAEMLKLPGLTPRTSATC